MYHFVCANKGRVSDSLTSLRQEFVSSEQGAFEVEWAFYDDSSVQFLLRVNFLSSFYF